jgi:dimethylglycine dehydrogenase
VQNLKFFSLFSLYFYVQIHGGLLTPGEGHIDPYSLTQALATGARKWGAQILLNSEA